MSYTKAREEIEHTLALTVCLDGMDLLIKNVDHQGIRRERLEIYKRAYQGWEEYAYRTEHDILGYLKWLQKRVPQGFLVAFLEERPNRHKPRKLFLNLLLHLDALAW